MINIKSDYYETDIQLSEEAQELMADMYFEVAKKNEFKPEINSAEDINDGSMFDHVMYHIEINKNDFKNYDELLELLNMEI